MDLQHQRPADGVSAGKHRKGQDSPYKAIMIDQDSALTPGSGIFRTRRCGIVCAKPVYQGVIGQESFEPWLDRLNRAVNEKVLATILQEIRRIVRG